MIYLCCAEKKIDPPNEPIRHAIKSRRFCQLNFTENDKIRLHFAFPYGVDIFNVLFLTPLPGTALHERLDKENRVLTKDWELYDGQHVVFQPSQMSVSALEQGNTDVWRKVYSYGSIARRMRHTPASKMLYLAANFGYRHYAKRLDQFYTCDWRLLKPDPPRLQANKGL